MPVTSFTWVAANTTAPLAVQFEWWRRDAAECRLEDTLAAPGRQGIILLRVLEADQVYWSVGTSGRIVHGQAGPVATSPGDGPGIQSSENATFPMPAGRTRLEIFLVTDGKTPPAASVRVSCPSPFETVAVRGSRSLLLADLASLEAAARGSVAGFAGAGVEGQAQQEFLAGPVAAFAGWTQSNEARLQVRGPDAGRDFTVTPDNVTRLVSFEGGAGTWTVSATGGGAGTLWVAVAALPTLVAPYDL